jgi:hypothetical protein
MRAQKFSPNQRLHRLAEHALRLSPGEFLRRRVKDGNASIQICCNQSASNTAYDVFIEPLELGQRIDFFLQFPLHLLQTLVQVGSQVGNGPESKNMSRNPENFQGRVFPPFALDPM